MFEDPEKGREHVLEISGEKIELSFLSAFSLFL